ncbi:hypothetical protein [Methylobacterium haplocladii]|nr:hypothetical protein [Methylobacterium haplocladii]
MAADTAFWVEGFEHVAGRLVPTTRRTALGESNALQQAEALARRLPGAAAFALVTGEDGSEAQTILGAFGDVPDDVMDGLAGG